MGFTNIPCIKRTKPSTVFGHIEGWPVGSTFENRLYLHHSSIHTGIVAGIAGKKDVGCYSVVMSGGYEDDKDEGNQFTYTGCGGRDRSDGEKPREGPQTCDQSWDNSRNASLSLSAQTKKPVRVVRGYKSSSDFAPARGYRYDGLYIVERAWLDIGKSGFKVCKFLFRRLPGQRPIPRRQDTLHLDLAEWETPRHYWKDTAPPPSSSRSPSPPHADRSSREKSSGKRKERASGADKGPIAGSSKTSPDVDKEIDDMIEAPMTSDQPCPRAKVAIRPPVPILPTTNAAPVRPAQPRPQQAQAGGPAPDVHELLALWHGSKATSSESKPAPSTSRVAPSAPKPTPSAYRPANPSALALPSKPSSAPGSGHTRAQPIGGTQIAGPRRVQVPAPITAPQTREPPVGNGQVTPAGGSTAIRRQRSSDEAERADVKRVKVANPSGTAADLGRSPSWSAKADAMDGVLKLKAEKTY